MDNSIKQCLEERNVRLPSEPLNFSSQLTQANINQSYIIVMTGRCGSTWLATALAQLNGFGNPLEYFSEEALPHYWGYDNSQEFSDVFLGILRKYSDNGCFGFKINPQRLFWLGDFVDLPNTFSPQHTAWIDMRRWNLVKQGFSFALAKKTGRWHRYIGEQKGGDTNINNTVDISDYEIWRDVISIIKQEQLIDSFYKRYGLSPLRIWYEEIFDSKDQLLVRVAKCINENFEGLTLGVDGKTERLSNNTYSMREIEFVSKYANLINSISSMRDVINTDELGKNLASLGCV